MKRAFEVLCGFIILFFMAVVFWRISSMDTASPIVTPEQPEPTQNITAEFAFALEEAVRIEIGQPIEGYEPQMFMQVFPGLLEEDFNDVEAEIGVYKYRYSELKHEIPQDVLVHSAASAISEKGMNTLLNNVVKRLSPESQSVSVKEIISKIKLSDGDGPVACTMEAKMCPDGSFVGRVGPNCEFEACSSGVVDSFEDCVAAGNPVMESYPRQCNHNGQHFVEEIDEPVSEFPIRYGEDASRIEEYRADCENRMGVFNECGSACGPEAEMCIDVCSMICEGPADEHMPPIPPEVEPDDVVFCTPEQKSAKMCTMEYAPVCGRTEVQCITSPCPPVEETFGNACGACAGGADYYTVGACES